MSYNSGVGVGRESMIKEVGKVNRMENEREQGVNLIHPPSG